MRARLAGAASADTLCSCQRAGFLHLITQDNTTTLTVRLKGTDQTKPSGQPCSAQEMGAIPVTNN